MLSMFDCIQMITLSAVECTYTTRRRHPPIIHHRSQSLIAFNIYILLLTFITIWMTYLLYVQMRKPICTHIADSVSSEYYRAAYAYTKRSLIIIINKQLSRYIYLLSELPLFTYSIFKHANSKFIYRFPSFVLFVV